MIAPHPQRGGDAAGTLELVQARGLSAWQAVWLGGLFGVIGCTIGSARSLLAGRMGRPATDPALRPLDYGQ